MKFAILEDYQEAAEKMVDWSGLPQEVELEVFTDHLADEGQLEARLEDFQIIMGMRERTPFPRSLLARLPELRLLITTGDHNASFDLKAATEMGIVVGATCPRKTGEPARAAGEPRWVWNSRAGRWGYWDWDVSEFGWPGSARPLT